jgi:protein-S-isoprenylcysteine O-methyltransferase Ste14
LFGIASRFVRRGSDQAPPTNQEARSAPHSRSLLALHMLAFGVMYFGVANAVIPDRVPEWFPGQRIVGSLVILSGSALMAAARAAFHSWRFRAQLDAGHQLATGGPFRLVRHPIYLGLDLLALGTAVWIPSPLVWIGVLLMVLGSDLRARAEEKLLVHAFGAAYTEYASRTRGFIPGVY